MNTLQTIQKTFRVFGILSKIAYIFSIIGAVFCAVGALCCLVWYNGGHVFSLFGEPIFDFAAQGDVSRAMAVLLSDLVFLSADAILLFFANRYFTREQLDGTPFTQGGAELVKKLGIRCIYLPIVAAVIVSVLLLCLGQERDGDINNLPSVATGIVLILASLIFRYGAQLEQGRKNEAQ